MRVWQPEKPREDLGGRYSCLSPRGWTSQARGALSQGKNRAAEAMRGPQQGPGAAPMGAEMGAYPPPTADTRVSDCYRGVSGWGGW